MAFEFSFMRLLVILGLLCFFKVSYGQDTIPFQKDQQNIFMLQNLRICKADLMQWANQERCEGYIQNGRIDNRNFQVNDSNWIHASVILPDDYQSVLALKAVNFRGAHDVYWDGELIAQNGKINTVDRQPKMGRYQFYAVIPPHLLTAGEHHLAIEYLKLGNSHYPTSRLFLGDYFRLAKYDLISNNQMILMLMVFLTSAMFFLIFYFGFGRKVSFLFLSVYCFAYCIKSILKPYQDFFTPDFLIPYMSFEISHLPANLGSIFLIAFLLWEMAIPKKGWLLLAFALLSIWAYFNMTEVQFLITLMISSGAIVGYGILKKAEGIGWIVIGFIGFVTLIILWMQGALSYGYFAGVIFFLVCMTFSVGQRIAKQIKLKQAALLRSATLENQLLKKSIQPHFILNSLASLQELIDQSPKKASDFVEQLAEEFRLVSKVSNQQLISIKDELNLCRIHLKIMEYRKSSNFELKTDGLTGDEKVPPGIFHTLLENGITHGYGTKRNGQFVLSKTQNNGHIEYKFFNDGDIASDINNPKRSKGTGLKYVEARLKGAYKDNWTLVSHEVKGGWEVIIGIKQSFFDKVYL